MITRLLRLSAPDLIPYRNQALEKYLLDSAGENDCMLYLWRNRRTVVIGRNQNAWSECDCTALEKDGGFLARRLSGGGAVYHDEGNLNFTFVCRRKNYYVPRQMQVILKAVRGLGIPAELSGRNDITAGGRKFSGNAFYSTETACMHHGTLLLTSSADEIARYLTVSKEKLASKGVASVQSRVTNLSEYIPGISTQEVSQKLAESFSAVYGLPVEPYMLPDAAGGELAAAEKMFASWEWKYGRRIPFTCEKSRRFAWGSLTVQLAVSGGLVTDAALWTDALDVTLAEQVSHALHGARFTRESFAECITAVRPADGTERVMLSDIRTLLEELI